jgi:hypothetical protein
LNGSFAIRGFEEFTAPFVVVFLAVAIPVWVGLAVHMVRFAKKIGVLGGYLHPILAVRWFWWLIFWPAPEEPAIRRGVVLGAGLLIPALVVIGALRFGFPPGKT